MALAMKSASSGWERIQPLTECGMLPVELGVGFVDLLCRRIEVFSKGMMLLDQALHFIGSGFFAAFDATGKLFEDRMGRLDRCLGIRLLSVFFTLFPTISSASKYDSLPFPLVTWIKPLNISLSFIFFFPFRCLIVLSLVLISCPTFSHWRTSAFLWSKELAIWSKSLRPSTFRICF